jgi:hypothetical protein
LKLTAPGEHPAPARPEQDEWGTTLSLNIRQARSILMFMASRVKSRGKGRAVAAPHSQAGNQAIGDRVVADIQAAIDALDRASSAPVDSMRGRISAGRFGLLSLAALTFSTIKGAWASDANVTFLDDDSIAYKNLEHGVFELVT